MTWYGRGPGEGYRDKKLSQRAGVHAVPAVADLWTDYEFPQDGVTEQPRVGSTELWEIVNLTEDAAVVVGDIGLQEARALVGMKFGSWKGEPGPTAAPAVPALARSRSAGCRCSP